MPADAVASSPSVPDLQHRIASLEAELRERTAENARLLAEQREALEQQTATAEVLQVINSSPGELAPVFVAMLDKALKLCGAAFGVLWTYDGEYIHATAIRGATAAYIEFLTSGPHRPGDTLHGRLLRGSEVEHIADMADSDDYRSGEATPRALVDLGGGRSRLAVALRKEGVFLGDIVIYRREVRPFSAKEIALLQNFAAQAVIAMENARLLGELRQRTDDLTESLEYQTATSELLEVISRSPTDIQPVLDNILLSAGRLCEAKQLGVALRYGDVFRFLATTGVSPELDLAMRTHEYRIDRSSVIGRVALDGAVVHLDDAQADPDYATPSTSVGGLHSILGVPLLRDDEVAGVIVAARDRVEAFAERQIALLKTFADQAVIAMENARLLGELRESLDQQTATTQVLQVINSSPGDIGPVFETILEKAHALCGVAYGSLQLYDGEKFRAVAVHGLPQALADLLRAGYVPGPTHPVRPLLAGGDSVQIPDMAGLSGASSILQSSGLRTALFVALRKDDLLLGQIVAARDEIRPFTDKETSLLRSFAQQAVIAMENARLLTEQREALEQQTATADILRVISQSPTDVQPVLDVVVNAALRFCGGQDALIGLRDDDQNVVPRAHAGTLGAGLGDVPAEHVRQLVIGRSISSGKTVHLWDPSMLDSDEARAVWTKHNVKAAVAAPMLREGVAMGTVLLRKQEAGPFTPRQIQLLEAFAAQAVIAIENVRLFNELQSSNDGLKEALDKQTATSEILRVISGSPTNVEPVFKTILANANKLCGASFSLLWLWEGEALRAVAHEHVNPKLAEFIARARPLPNRHTPLGLSVLERTVVHVEDVLADPRFVPEEVPIYRHESARSILAVPMIREGILVGVINIWRREPGAFTDGQIALVQTFAAQAVIAIENVRLFTELREALEQQTATADILRVISQSLTDVEPVLEAVASAARRYCGATDVLVTLREGANMRVAAHDGSMRTVLGVVGSLDPTRISGRCILQSRTIHVPDVDQLDPVEFATTHELGRRVGFRAIVGAPMLRDGGAIGSILLRKPDRGAFTPRQIQLLETFAAQAVIAIENVRLFTELREALEQQTATADILRVISQSPTDVGPVLTAVAKAALKFCNAGDALVALRDDDRWVVAAHEGPIEAPAGLARPLNRASVPGRAIVDGDVVQVTDFQSVEADEYPLGREISALRGFRAALAAPLLLDRHAIGAISLRRTEAGGFTPNQVELLKSFAAQAVIAIENVRLFTELRDSLERLKAAQANLIQAEKMASLGQLTAGIAHEIKNPLNFVNNFAGLSSELLDELKQAVDPLLGRDDDKRAEVQETLEILNSNLAKILEHGRRADGIVKSMLAHSRGGTGNWQTSSINGLIEEALNLAYHGARAQDQDFNVMVERDFDAASRPIDVVPQDVTRVFLNLFGNGFYATRKRQRQGDDEDGGYQPTLRVSTRDLGEAVEVRVRDNGIGIAPELRDRLFQPFFTTKPTGEGTGLGLSISYDIVTQQHGGSIEVESEVGHFTEFTVRLPRARRAASGDSR